jgi:hypothetical protein
MVNKIIVKTALLLAILNPPLLGLSQNWAARMYSSSPTNDPYRILNGPTNWIAEWTDVGTNKSVDAPLVFVGDELAKSLFISVRVGAYRNWKTNTWDVQETLAQSNATFQVNANLFLLSRLISSNQTYLGAVTTNRPLVGTLGQSNQIINITRQLNLITPLLRELYKGD